MMCNIEFYDDVDKFMKMQRHQCTVCHTTIGAKTEASSLSMQEKQRETCDVIMLVFITTHILLSSQCRT